jgi:predicted Fe-Mo cluster-binding NifX family protein
MRVAVSTDGEMVAAHFGRCEAYTLADIKDGKVAKNETIAKPGHEPGFMPGYLAERGLQCIVAGGMGSRTKMLFDQHRIQPIVDVSATISQTIEALCRGELRGGESMCEH